LTYAVVVCIPAHTHNIVPTDQYLKLAIQMNKQKLQTLVLSA